MFIGFGPGDFVMLGGVKVPHTHGVEAHSDGDVILHALCDAMLGAAGLGDIGQHFKDSDPQWRGADSKTFVRSVMNMLLIRKLRVGNADITVLAEFPKVGPVRDEIRKQVAELLEVEEEFVNVKATTTEKLGFLGRKEGIAAQAVVLLLDARDGADAPARGRAALRRWVDCGARPAAGVWGAAERRGSARPT